MMAILDAGPMQDWIRAFDRHELSKRRWDAANATGNRALIDYLRGDVDSAARDLNAALKTLNELSR